VLCDNGASPVGLGARDTLRLEAGLPLYGHEFGTGTDGNEIPIFACPLAKFAVSFDESKGNFVGREALLKQYDARCAFAEGDYSAISDLPRMIRQIAIVGRGIARAGDRVLSAGRDIGWVSSGTMVPYWKSRQEDDGGVVLTEQSGMRAVALAMLESNVKVADMVEVMVRGRETAALVVNRNLESGKGPVSYAVLHESV
jgi:aminomethyltransferase